MNDLLPVLKNYPQTLQDTYIKRIKSLGNHYIPRTIHLNKDGSAKFVNRLILEESPYLMQHAHNPVNWYAWSAEAFATAKKLNKPIFLSIGYATCHWCHVMEHESFEDLEIASFINEHFIAVKVDRERRTAIDAYYMTGVQMMTGHGGWPMSNFITPEGQPFFGGTYYNPTQFMTLLSRVNDTWNEHENGLRIQALQMDTAINKYLSKSKQAEEINQLVFKDANSQLLSMHDDLQGGFSGAPKFPQEPWLLYLLSQDKMETNKTLLSTLDEMQQGGIYDQVGGGFHRYATDNEWLTPHFEKMLYNQSQLSEVYTQAALNFNKPDYQRTATAIMDYVLTEMVSKHNVFFSAGDADSQGEEGLFFTWTAEELASILSEEDFLWLQKIYHFSKRGNFEQRNIFFLSEPLKQTARKLKLSYSELITRLNKINATLYLHRSKRITPLIDDKIITSWNAQMVYSLVYSSHAFDNKKYLQAAIKAMDYLLLKHINNQGFLVRNSLNGKVSHINAELEDYAWMITALIKLYDITAQQSWLKQAKTLILQTERHYIDRKNGGFFDNIPETDIPNTSRIKKSEDGAIVSANGQLLIALARYYRRTGDLHVEELFTQALASFSGKITSDPISHTSMLHAKQIFDHGENSNIAYTGNGKVKITTARDDKHVSIKFMIKDGWHINSNLTNIDSLIPLSINFNNKLDLSYPQAKITQLDFSKDDLSTFDGMFEVVAPIDSDTQFPLSLKISLQACSSKICLSPDELSLKVFNY